MLLDVVILPPAGLREKIGRRMRKETAGCPAEFVVDNVKLIPHLSLWHLNTAGGRINKIAEELEKIAEDLRPFTVNVADFHASQVKRGMTVGFSVARTRSLVSLQRKVFERIHPLRTGTMPLLTFKTWTAKDLREFGKYGRPTGFSPHFSMGYLKNPRDALEVRERTKGVGFSFIAKEMYLCRVNKRWQVDKIIKKIDFN